LLYAVGIKSLDEETIGEVVDSFAIGVLTDEIKDLFIGKRIKFLNFVSGTYTNEEGIEKPSYKVWNGNGEGFDYANTWDVNTDNEEIIKLFKEKLESNNPPNYTPEVLKEFEENSNSDNSSNDEDDDSVDKLMI